MAGRRAGRGERGACEKVGGAGSSTAIAGIGRDGAAPAWHSPTHVHGPWEPGSGLASCSWPCPDWVVDGAAVVAVPSWCGQWWAPRALSSEVSTSSKATSAAAIRFVDLVMIPSRWIPGRSRMRARNLSRPRRKGHFPQEDPGNPLSGGGLSPSSEDVRSLTAIVVARVYNRIGAYVP